MSERQEWERRERNREPQREFRGDWGGNERGWESRPRNEEWNADRRSDRGGLDRGSPSQNREEWSSRSSWGYGGRGREEWERNRGRQDDSEPYREYRSQRDFDREGREGHWSSGNWGTRDSAREGGWNEGRYGGRPNWTDRPESSEPERYADRERGSGYDWDRSGTWGSEQSGRYDRGSQSGQHFPSEHAGGTGAWGAGRSSMGAGWGGNYSGGLGTYGERGRFAGRGPRNWQRSDERIREDINEQLTRHPGVDATDLEVTVASAEVTLSGTVDDRHAKRLAEEIAENVTGVRQVHNQIRVQSQHVMGAAHSTPEIAGGQKAGSGSSRTEKK